jgi:hypothetical protein
LGGQFGAISGGHFGRFFQVNMERKIFPIKDFFCSDDYNLTPKDYEVFLEIKF